MKVSNHSYRPWRQFIGCLAAYALALHGILVAFSGLPVAAGNASDDGTLGFELCLHDRGALSPDTPSAPARVDVHCKFCVAHAHSSLAVPTPSGVRLMLDTAGTPLRVAPGRHAANSFRYFRKQPRGPPLTA
jgi:hypothetical protein